jgi:hypothetical protein
MVEAERRIIPHCEQVLFFQERLCGTIKASTDQKHKERKARFYSTHYISHKQDIVEISGPKAASFGGFAER